MATYHIEFEPSLYEPIYCYWVEEKHIKRAKIKAIEILKNDFPNFNFDIENLSSYFSIERTKLIDI